MKDRVDKKEVKIEHCQTDIMLADFFTKPLQSTLFNKLRRVLMGYKYINTLRLKGFVNKEHVEQKVEKYLQIMRLNLKG